MLWKLHASVEVTPLVISLIFSLWKGKKNKPKTQLRLQPYASVLIILYLCPEALISAQNSEIYFPLVF